MKCPKCQADMEKVATAHGVVDRCTSCMGLWFDLMEHEEMKQDAEMLDIGSSEIGRINNTIGNIDCPVCPSTRMIRMVDPQQPHIWFESCPVCYGRYLDAGEFRDLSALTLGDWFKRFRARARD